MKRQKLTIFSFMIVLVSGYFMPLTAEVVNAKDTVSNNKPSHQVEKTYATPQVVDIHLAQEVDQGETTSYKNADGSIVYPGETGDTTVYPDGKTVYPDGTTVHPDGKTVAPDGIPVPPELGRADKKVGIGDYRGAIEELNEFLLNHPDNADGYFRRGNYKNIVGNYQEAIEDLHKSAQLYSAQGLIEMHDQAVRTGELVRRSLHKR